MKPRARGDSSPPDSRSRVFLQAWWGEVTTVAPGADAHWPAVRVGLCVTVPLGAVLLLGRADWAPYAVYASLSSVYGKHLAYRARLQAQIVTGAAMFASVAVGTLVGVVAPGSLLAVLAMGMASAGGLWLSWVFGLWPVPSLFMVLALGTLSSYQHPWSDLGVPMVLGGLSAAFSLLMGQLGRWVPVSRRQRRDRASRSELREMVTAAGFRRESVAYLVGPLVAGSIATLVGVGHPYWAAVTATVPLIGRTLATRAARGTLRTVGTVAGIGLGYLLLVPFPPLWVLLIAVAVLQVLTEFFVARNYGLAVTFVTPIALVLSDLGTHEPVGELLRYRLVETLIGTTVAVGILVAGRLLPERLWAAPRRVTSHPGDAIS